MPTKQDIINVERSRDIKEINKSLTDVIRQVEENDKHYYIVFVDKKDFEFVRNGFVGICTIILIAVVNAILRGVLK